MDVVIKYLTDNEKKLSRTLWEEAFPEDSKSFDDYYYQEKIKDNQILVLENEKGITSMLHLNPYLIAVRNHLWSSVYIVGVATRADSRRQGQMRKILQKMLIDLYQKQMEFCFLMPADEKIYLPFSFTYIFDQPDWKLAEENQLLKKEYSAAIASNDLGTLDELVELINQILVDEFEVFSLRTREYLIQLLKEIESENGNTSLIYDQDRLIGIEGEWGIQKRTSRMLLCECKYRSYEMAKKPAIMARIVHLPAFLVAISLRPDSDRESLNVKISVDDPWIEENQGTFIWKLTKETSFLEPLSVDSDHEHEELTLSIQNLTSWLFGYLTLEQQLATTVPSWVGQVRTLAGVYLDEIV